MVPVALAAASRQSRRRRQRRLIFSTCRWRAPDTRELEREFSGSQSAAAPQQQPLPPPPQFDPNATQTASRGSIIDAIPMQSLAAPKPLLLAEYRKPQSPPALCLPVL